MINNTNAITDITTVYNGSVDNILCTIQHQTWIPPSNIGIRIIKNKDIPVTGRGGPEGSETSRLPHFLDSRLTESGEVVSLTRRPPFAPQEDSWYPFLLRGWVKLQGHSVAGRIRSIEKSISSGIDPATLRVVV
jgi:hypothetical protein